MRLTDRALRTTCWTLFALFFATGWGSSLVLLANPGQITSDWGSSDVIANLGFGVMVTLFPLVGALIIQQQPRNRIGWVLTAIGATWALASLGDMYTAWALVLHPGSLPGGEVVVAVNSSMWLPPILLMGVYLILLFPDGRLPSPRWRILPWATLAVGVTGMLAISLFPGPIDDVAIPVKENPIGVEALAGLEVVFAFILPLIPLSVLAAAVATVLRYRRASGTARLQMKWLMAAGSLVAVLFATTMAMSMSNLFRTASGDDNAVQTFFQTISITSFGLVPIAIGIAITRHKLYDIDALISRALVVGALGVFVTALYVGTVVGVGTLIGQRQPSVWLSVLATAMVAVLFQPVRERVHRLGEPARLRLAGNAVRGALRLLGQHGRALHHRGAAPADGTDRLGVPRRRPRGGLAALRAGDGVRRGLARRA